MIEVYEILAVIIAYLIGSYVAHLYYKNKINTEFYNKGFEDGKQTKLMED